MDIEAFAGEDGDAVVFQYAPVILPAAEAGEVVRSHDEDEFILGLTFMEGVEGAYGVMRFGHVELNVVYPYAKFRMPFDSFDCSLITVATCSAADIILQRILR